MNKKLLLITLAIFISRSQLWTSQLSQKERELINAVTYMLDDQVQQLLHEGVNPNIKTITNSMPNQETIETPILIIAAQNGDVHIVSMLLKAGADEKAVQSNTGNTALDVAKAYQDYYQQLVLTDPNDEQAPVYLDMYNDTVDTLKIFHPVAQG